MKIFQLIDWITRLFKLNKKAKTVTLLLLSYSMYGQNNAMFWGSQFNKATNTSVSYFLDEQPNAIAAYSFYTAANYGGLTLGGDLTGTDNTQWANISGFEIGVRLTNNSQIFNGKIGEIQYYSDQLTASEVLQNYNATKTRYGY